jgi:hypothetical protein
MPTFCPAVIFFWWYEKSGPGDRKGPVRSGPALPCNGLWPPTLEQQADYTACLAEEREAEEREAYPLYWRATNLVLSMNSANMHDLRATTLLHQRARRRW